MTKEVFFEKFADILDTESKFEMETKLEDIEEWDSLSIVSFLAFAKGIDANKVVPSSLKAAKTVEDLYNLIADV